MAVNIYVGNLSYDCSEEDLKREFGGHGDVSSVKIISDYDTGRSKGFGFVEMSNDDEARAAIEQLNGVDLQGRNIKVNEAHPRENRGPRH